MLIDLRKKDESKTQQNTGENDYLANNRNISATNTSTPNPTHTKSTRALIRFYLNLYHANMERMQGYLADDSNQARAIVENAANNIVRIWARLDELGGAK